MVANIDHYIAEFSTLAAQLGLRHDGFDLYRCAFSAGAYGIALDEIVDALSDFREEL